MYSFQGKAYPHIYTVIFDRKLIAADLSYIVVVCVDGGVMARVVLEWSNWTNIYYLLGSVRMHESRALEASHSGSARAPIRVRGQLYERSL